MIHRLLLGREALGGDFLVNSSVDHWATTNVHHPFTPTMRFQGSRACGVYGDFVHELDWIVGEVVMSLKPAHGANNTLVIFTSDNGGMFNLNMAVAVSDSPDGLWERLATNPALKNSDDPEDFDSHLVDDAGLIRREGKRWFPMAR